MWEKHADEYRALALKDLPSDAGEKGGKKKKKAEAAGKGTFGQVGAGLKSAREREEQYQIATMGTTRSRSNLMRLFGIQTGSFFQQNFDKKASQEEIEKAKKLRQQSAGCFVCDH